MEESIYKVYIKTDENGNITDINSDIFLSDVSDWTEIDEGTGDRYAHAQNNYFEKPLIDDGGRYNYMLINGKAEEIQDNEKPLINNTAASLSLTMNDVALALTEIYEMLLEVV